MDPNQDELPTYANSEAQNGGSPARWNRWRGWVEKRAAERFVDEPTQRRPATGWDLEDDKDDESVVTDLNGRSFPVSRQSTLLSLPPDYENETPAPPPGQLLDPCHLALYTYGSRFLPHSPHPITSILPILSSKFILIGTTQGLSVLDVYPSLHASSAELPITVNLHTSPPLTDAVVVPLWRGEAVHQLILVEDSTSEEQGDSSGIVLALISPIDDKGNECGNKVVRLYNLASLVNLVRWATSQKDQSPIDVQRANPPQQAPTSPSKHVLRKQHRHQRSGIRQSLKALIVDQGPPALPPRSSAAATPTPMSPTKSPLLRGVDPFFVPPSSPAVSMGGRMTPTRDVKDRSLFSGAASTKSNRSPSRLSSVSSLESDTDDTWDMVDELPFRWATDFAPFATSQNRLNNVSVQFMELWRSNDSKGSMYLALATKTNILLYTSSKGERGFTFIKEFYTPFSAKSVTIIQQVDPPRRSKSSAVHVRDIQHQNSSKRFDYGTQLSLFVTFDKKAGLIRVADSAVTEVEPFPDIGTAAAAASNPGHVNLGHRRNASSTSEPVTPASSIRRGLASLDGGGFWRGSPPWLPLTELKLPEEIAGSASPSPGSPASSQRPINIEGLCFLTRGQTTQIVPSPLPVSFGSSSGSANPLRTLIWHCPPTRIIPRICCPPLPAFDTDEPAQPAFLQLIGIGREGLEVQEIPLNFLASAAAMLADGKGKGKVPSSGAPFDPDCARAYADVGGRAAFIGFGGNGDIGPAPFLDPSAGAVPMSLSSPISPNRARQQLPPLVPPRMNRQDSMDTVQKDIRSSEGVYATVVKGPHDHRIFWLGCGWDLQAHQAMVEEDDY